MSDAAVAETPKVAKRPTRSWSNYWPYLLAALVGLLAKLPTLNNNIIFIDEPTYLMHARRLDSLETFFYSFSYRTEPKFQLGLLPDLLALAISPPNAILIVRLCGLVAVMVSGGLLLDLSKLMFGERVPGWFAWLLWLFFLNRNAADVVPLLEYFQTPLLLFSLWLLIKASGRSTYIFWAGFMVALAGLIKPTALIVAPVLILGLYALAHPWLKPGKWSFVKRLAGQIAWLGSGISLPLGVFILPYLLRPTALADLKFNLIEISSSYGALGNKSLLTRTLELLAIFENTNLGLIIISGLSYLVIKVFAFSPFRGPQGRKAPPEIGLPPLQAKIRGTTRLNWREGWQHADTYQLLLWLMGWGLFAGFAVGQAKFHYLVPILPFLLLFVGYRLRLLHHWLPHPRLKLAFATLLTLWLILSEAYAIIFNAGLYFDNGNIYRAQMPNLDEAALINYIQLNSAPQDYIWVYYNAPEIYWLADRRPATSDSVGSWLVYMYTPFWFERIQRELEQDNPTLIIGIDQPRYPLASVDKLTELPRLKDWLVQKYTCSEAVVPQAIVCKRNIAPAQTKE